jgi:hypothetical protein
MLILCHVVGAICAFMSGTGGDFAGVLKPLAQDLVDHGCK